jgi:pimeloyl-ACP methyl ester carboxylesterase
LWNDRVMARFTLRAPFYRPGRFASKIECPVLYCIAEHDSICPPEMATKVAEKTPRGEVKRYPIGHFEICLGDDFDRATADQREFLVRHLLGEQAVPDAALEAAT